MITIINKDPQEQLMDITENGVNTSSVISSKNYIDAITVNVNFCSDAMKDFVNAQEIVRIISEFNTDSIFLEINIRDAYSIEILKGIAQYLSEKVTGLALKVYCSDLNFLEELTLFKNLESYSFTYSYYNNYSKDIENNLLDNIENIIGNNNNLKKLDLVSGMIREYDQIIAKIIKPLSSPESKIEALSIHFMYDYAYPPLAEAIYNLMANSDSFRCLNMDITMNARYRSSNNSKYYDLNNGVQMRANCTKHFQWLLQAMHDNLYKYPVILTNDMNLNAEQLELLNKIKELSCENDALYKELSFSNSRHVKSVCSAV